MKEVRSRFAPSPTGFMHVGNLRSTLFEYLIAKANNGKFILRIEDTDQSRKVDGAIEFIYDTLKLCGIEIDEGPLNGGEYGPYIQSERLNLYKEYADKLVESGHAYYCFCSENRLEELRTKAEEEKKAFLYDKHCLNLAKEEIRVRIANGEKYVVRQNVSPDGVSKYTDLVYGDIEIENKYIEDQILLKSDGYPTYNFANVIDDHLMNITHVVRGCEYLSSTPKYNMLYDAFGWERPIYVHLPSVNGMDGKKLSKRNGDASFMDLYNSGYLSEAIVNYLALLGWSSKDNKEIFSMNELIESFDISRINTSPAKFDIDKLKWINHHYIQELNDDKLYSIFAKFLKEKYNIEDSEWLKALIVLYKDELHCAEDLINSTELFFKNEITYSDECLSILSEEGVDNLLNIFKEEINLISDWNIENITNAINNAKDKSGMKGKMLYMPIRIKVSGQMHGPELPNTIYLIGKEKILERL